MENKRTSILLIGVLAFAAYEAQGKVSTSAVPADRQSLELTLEMWLRD